MSLEVKIKSVNISGNEVFSDWKIRRQMKTKRKNFLRFWKRSKFIDEQYEKDKDKIVKKYKSQGYRDARIVSDSIIRLDEDDIAINLKIEEGNKYYFGNISFLGNSVYSDEQLKQVLGIQKGDVYNGVLLKKKNCRYRETGWRRLNQSLPKQRLFILSNQSS